MCLFSGKQWINDPEFESLLFLLFENVAEENLAALPESMESPVSSTDEYLFTSKLFPYVMYQVQKHHLGGLLAMPNVQWNLYSETTEGK